MSINDNISTIENEIFDILKKYFEDEFKKENNIDIKSEISDKDKDKYLKFLQSEKKDMLDLLSL